MDIHLNVGRSRLTILSITLALFLFSTGVFMSLADQMGVRPVWAFLTSFVGITLGFSLTLLALLLFLTCQRLQREGCCEIWSFSCGELVMYLALSQTLSGGLGIFVAAISGVLETAPSELGLSAEHAAGFRAAAGGLGLILQIGAGLVWASIVYIAPTVFLLRNPLPWRSKRWLAAGYVALLVLVCLASAFGYQLKARGAGRDSSVATLFVAQLWQPVLWRVDDELPLRPIRNGP